MGMATHYCDKCLVQGTVGVPITQNCSDGAHHFVPFAPGGVSNVGGKYSRLLYLFSVLSLQV